jgi:AcrR family transcriptional regulator
MRALCDENFERLRGDDRVAARVALAAIAHGDEQVATELRKHYGALTADLAATYEQVLDVWNVSMRYPLTSTSIAVIVSALTEGLVIRSYIDPISTPPSILADAVLALFPGTVDAQKSGERVETMLETFHSERSPSPTPPGSIAVDLHQKLMSAARANLRDQRGLDALSPEQLAADCDEPLTAVRRLYASPFSVLVAVCRPLRDSLVQSLEADHMFGFDARVSTERHFARLSVLLHQTPALAETLVLSGVRSSPSAARAATTLDIPGVVTATIAAGQAEGTVSSVYPPDRLAVLLSQTVALCVLDPDGGAEDVSALVASFLRG